MSTFKAKMHQIQFRLEFCPRPCWGAYSAPPEPRAGFKGPTSKGSWGGKEGSGQRGGVPSTFFLRIYAHVFW